MCSKEDSKKILGAVLGTFVYSAGVNLFVVPANLYTSGVLGICQLIRTLLVDYIHLPFHNFDFSGVIYYMVCIPMLLVAMTKVGKKFFFKTIIAITSMTVFLAIIPSVPVVHDRITSCVIGGIVAGGGVGITLRMGCTTGGVDLLGILITRKKKDFSVGKINLIVNGILYGTSLFLFDIEIVIYSLVFAAVYAFSMDKVHIQNINVEAKIVTKIDTENIEREVFEELGRGLTKWTSQGAYTQEESHVLFILLSKYEVNQLKMIVHKYDPNAFIVINEGVLVDGNFLKKL